MLKNAIWALLLVVFMAALPVRSLGQAIAEAEANRSAAVLSAAGIQMTLAGIAYVDDSNSLADIKTAIENELKKTNYATQGNWELVWGPALKGGNLAYIAQNKLSKEQFSLAIRGTDFNLLSNDIEDIWLKQEPYRYAAGAGRARVSSGSLAGLHHLQRMTDEVTAQSIKDFLTSAAEDAEIDLTITGHSLGGGLASLVLIWLYDVTPQWGIAAESIRLSAYTFAGPTVGNTDFAKYLDAKVRDRLHRFVNPLDVVPHSYGNLEHITKNGIPTAVPLKHKAILDALIAYLFINNLRFQQAGSEILLQSVPLPTTLPYLAHVVEQHRPNSYIYLLGAPQLDVGHPSLLPQYGP